MPRLGSQAAYGKFERRHGGDGVHGVDGRPTIAGSVGRHTAHLQPAHHAHRETLVDEIAGFNCCLHRRDMVGFDDV